jgi:hypothetical protein
MLIRLLLLLTAIVATGGLNVLGGCHRGSSLHSKIDDSDFAKKAAWTAAEIAGNAVASVSKIPPAKSSTSLAVPPATFAAATSCLRDDYDSSYFLSGKLSNPTLYTPDCTFADPFASFEGRDRFVSNLSNLSLFVKEYKTKVIDFSVDEDTNIVFVNVLVKLVLNLPWRPRLSWVWGVEHKLTASSPFQVTSHTESWSVTPWEGVRQVFRPGKPNKPLP